MSSLPMSDCTSCFEVKPAAGFPQGPLTPRCGHPTTVCLVCISSFLDSQSRNGLTEQLSCPECSELLTYDSIQDFASTDTFERYKTYSVDQLVSGTYTLIWCPICGAKMAHGIGAQQGITLCLACNRQFCSRHQVPWHADHTCDEYEQSLDDPGFRSKAQLNAAQEEAYGLQDEQLQQLIKDADDNFAHSLMSEKQASRARVEKKDRERRQAEERAAREAQRRREQEEAEKLMKRKRQEEELTNQSVRRVTKPCPGCHIPIEKNGGCDHMICGRCHLHFYWSSATW